MRKRKGFTLAELLIVVAIIAVLVAISIPIFTNQLEKSRESTDLANVRAVYAEVMTEANSDSSGDTSKVISRSVELKQKTDGWQRGDDLTLGGIKSSDTTHWKNSPKNGGTCLVSYSEATSVVIDWDGKEEHPFTTYKKYLEANWASIQNKEYSGYLVKTSSGISFCDSLSGNLGVGAPEGAVVYVYSDGTNVLFHDIATKKDTTWAYGSDWDESKLPKSE